MTMPSSNPSYRRHQLRKVAILVATLGDSLGEQLLNDLPPDDASEVRLLVENLDEIDADEYEAVVADFRQGTAQQVDEEPVQSYAGGVELDPSLLARLESGDEHVENRPSLPPENPWRAINDADASTLVEVLSAEQPQTIAAVLARLEAAQAADLITKLHPTLQAEVLTRLSDIDPADEQSLQVVESQLASWIEAKHRRQERMAAGFEMVQRILDNTQNQQRVAVLQRLGERNPQLASRLSNAQACAPAASANTPDRHTSIEQRAGVVSTPPVAAIDSQLPEPTDPLDTLESLDDQALLRALQSVDRDTVMLALAGASEKLLKRIVKGLPRRQAAQFRQQVRSMGPTRLSDMVAAQRELVRSSQPQTV